MFGWLANLLIKSPVVGSGCPYCEGQKEQLKQMQKAVLNGESDDYTESSDCGNCRCNRSEKQESEMKMTYHYHIE